MDIRGCTDNSTQTSVILQISKRISARTVQPGMCTWTSLPRGNILKLGCDAVILPLWQREYFALGKYCVTYADGVDICRVPPELLLAVWRLSRVPQLACLVHAAGDVGVVVGGQRDGHDVAVVGGEVVRLLKRLQVPVASGEMTRTKRGWNRKMPDCLTEKMP